MALAKPTALKADLNEGRIIFVIPARRKESRERPLKDRRRKPQCFGLFASYGPVEWTLPCREKCVVELRLS